MKMSFEELKEKYPQLWERVERKYQSQEAKRKAFLALVELEKSKEVEKRIRAKEQSKERKRRTRALILFGEFMIKYFIEQNWNIDTIKGMIKRRGGLKGKEGNKEIDYSEYILKEFEKVKEKSKTQTQNS